MPNAADGDMRRASRSADPIVYIVDDDPAVGDALTVVLETEGFRTCCFRTGRAFLERCFPGMQGCLLLDLCMPDYSGLEIQSVLAQQNVQMPIIFLTGYGSLPTSSAAFRNGAFDFLEKPVKCELLLQRVAEAIRVDERRSVHGQQRISITDRYARLSARERQVLHFVVNGLSTKEMAKEMGLSHRTVDTHRGHMMRKLGCSTLLQLMRAIAPLFDDDGMFD